MSSSNRRISSMFIPRQNSVVTLPLSLHYIFHILHNALIWYSLAPWTETDTKVHPIAVRCGQSQKTLAPVSGAAAKTIKTPLWGIKYNSVNRVPDLMPIDFSHYRITPERQSVSVIWLAQGLFNIRARPQKRNLIPYVYQHICLQETMCSFIVHLRLNRTSSDLCPCSNG